MKSGIKTTDPFFYPKREDVERIHNVLIAVRGEKGYVSKGMIDACIEFARTDTHQIIPFPTLITRASAILYSFVTFHPYADGNKRTSLVTASFFLFLNGYSFDIPNDAPEFTKNVALRCLDSEETFHKRRDSKNSQMASSAREPDRVDENILSFESKQG